MKKREFKVIVERDEDGFFVASVPALPGCHTQGKTMEELQENVRDVIALCLDVAKTDRAYQKAIAERAYEPSFIALETVSV